MIGVRLNRQLCVTGAGKAMMSETTTGWEKLSGIEGKHGGCSTCVMCGKYTSNRDGTPDGGCLRCRHEGPIADCDRRIDDVRRRSGAWTPLYELDEMSPDFTDTARSALLWVLWHHQGGSSPIGQPIRFALGMGAHERLSDAQIAEAKRWAARMHSTTDDFKRREPAA